MSQAYAKRVRNVAIATSAASAVFLAFGLYWIQHLSADGDEARRAAFVRFRPAGESLRFTHLAANERVVVTRVVNGDREDRAWTYVIDGATRELLTRMTRALVQEPGYGLRPADITASDAYAISTDDLAGLDAALRFIRIVPADPAARYYDTYAFEYLRNGELIGEERFIDDFLSRHGDLGYERLPVAATRAFSVEAWESLVTFAEIARRPSLESAVATPPPH